MPTNYEVVDSSKEQNPMIGLIGFVVMVVIGGISFLIAGPLTRYFKTAHVTIGVTGIKLLPLQFPPEWSPLGEQVAVASAMFLVIFVLAMIVFFMFMKPSWDSDNSISLDVMRKEVEARKKRHGG